MLITAFVAFALLVAAWIGYPLSLMRAARRAPAAPPLPSPLPPICVVIATRELPQMIAGRVMQLLTTDYPKELISFVVAVDYRSVHPIAAYTDALQGMARVIRGDEPGGKSAALNAGVRMADAELIVLADSQQTFDPPAIGLLVQGMQDPAFAAISGAIAITSGDGLMDHYWRYERGIREGQAAVHSVVSSTGQIAIVRRSCWPVMPAELICDDLYMTMRLVLAGHRVGYAPGALARDSRIFTREQHFQRKVRTLTGLVQVCAWLPPVLIPWRNPIWLHFAFHKLIRLVTPYLAIIVVLGVTGAAAERLADVRPVLYGALGLLALLGLAAIARPQAAQRRLAQVQWMLRLQLVPLIAMWNGLRGRWQVWHSHQPVQTAARAIEPTTPAATISLDRSGR